jgi:uncharacterized membrane protein YcaP (DUF421 family)
MFSSVDWGRLLLPGTPVLEIFVRGTVIYLGLFGLLRFVIRRETGSLGITDLLVIVLLADAAQNGMAGDYHSISDGLLLVSTIVLWSYALNWLAFRFRAFRRIVRPPALLLVKDGRPVEANLLRERISMDELLGEIRSHGLSGLEQVREAYIEPDGMISVISRKNTETDSDKKRQRGG